MTAAHAEGKCPECGGDLVFLEKNSFNGRVFREYLCTQCKQVVTEDGGVALWQVLHDANEANRDSAAETAPAVAPKKLPWWRFWG